MRHTPPAASRPSKRARHHRPRNSTPSGDAPEFDAWDDPLQRQLDQERADEIGELRERRRAFAQRPLDGEDAIEEELGPIEQALRDCRLQIAEDGR